MTSAVSPDVIADEMRDELRDVARKLIDRHWSAQQARSAELDDRDLYAAAADAGWLGLEIAPEYGGVGATFRETCAVLAEMGRGLVSGRAATTMVVGAAVISAAGSVEQREQLLPGLADGTLHVAVGLCDSNGRTDLATIGVAATPTSDGWLLSGTVAFVPDAATADRVVVVARDGDGALSLFILDPAAAGVEIEPVVAVDHTRKFATVRLDSVAVGAGELLGQPGCSAAVVEWLLQRSAVAIAADSTGGAERVLQISTEYATDRVQFGRPIGSFQAIKHLCADMLVGSEAAKAAAERAAAEVPAAPAELPEWSEWASIAKLYCADTYARIATDGVQVHGGIGYTWEHDMHLYVKRAMMNQALAGSSAAHRGRLGQVLLAQR